MSGHDVNDDDDALSHMLLTEILDRKTSRGPRPVTFPTSYVDTASRERAYTECMRQLSDMEKELGHDHAAIRCSVDHMRKLAEDKYLFEYHRSLSSALCQKRRSAEETAREAFNKTRTVSALRELLEDLPDNALISISYDDCEYGPTEEAWSGHVCHKASRNAVVISVKSRY